MPIGSVRRVLRQIRRFAIVLALVAVALVLGAIAAIHTTMGRELVRREIEKQLAGEFTGGATVGAYEGSPFTTMVLKDVAIRTPDGKSVAVRVGTLRIGVGLWSLTKHDVRLTELEVDDVDVRVGSDFGALVKPSPPSPGPSPWSVDAPAVEVTRGHVAIDRGGEPIDVDGISIGASAWTHAGATRGGSVIVAGTWRQRAGAPIAVIVHATDDGVRADVPAFVVRAGGVVATGDGLWYAAPRFGGRVAVIAPQAGVAALVPGVVLPDDVALTLAVAPDGDREVVALDGALGATPIEVTARADVAGRAIAGELRTGEVDLARVSRDAIAGVAELTRARFAVALDPGAALPRAEVHAFGHAAVSGAPGGMFAVEASTRGTRETLAASLLGPVQATIAAAATKDGERVVLERASVVASGRDVVDGVRGTAVLVLDAHGQLAPALDVAATGNAIATGITTDSLAVGSVRIDLAAARRGALTRGDVTIAAKGIAADPRAPISELTAHLHAAPGRATVDVAATSAQAHAKVALDVVAPQRLEDVAAWKARGRDALRSVELQLANVDLARVAQLVQPGRHRHVTRFDTPPPAPPIRGRLDGDIRITPTSATGKLAVTHASSPALRGVQSVDAELAFAAPTARELAPQLVVTASGIGTVTTRARLALPARLFDVPAWQRAGLQLVREVTVETTPIAFDPAFWDRFGIASSLRGRAKVTATASAGLDGLTVDVAAEDVRGTPLAEPVAIAARVAFAGKEATAQLGLTTKQGKTTLAKLDVKVPVSFAELRTGGAAALKAAGQRPLVATIALPKTDAKSLMNVFGHSEVTRGVLDGKVAIAGTLAHPTVTAHVTGEGLGVPPGPRGKPIQMLDHIAIDASYDAARTAKVTITGRENAGGTLAATLTGSAAAPLAGRAQIEAHHFDLGPLLAFAPGPAGGSRGTLDAKLTVAGFDPRTAHVLGEVHLARARMPIAPTVGTLRDAQIDISLREHDIGLKTTGKLGAGTVKLDGTIALDKGVDLTGGTISIQLRKVSPIGAIEPTVDADVTAKLARSGAQWKAEIVVEHGLVAITGKQGEAIKPSSNPSDLAITKGGKLPPPPAPPPPRAVHPSTTPEAPPPPAQPSLVATIVLKTTRVESAEVRTTLEGKLAITADAKSVGIVGQISANAGDVDLFDRRYHVERANVRFDGTVDPLLDVSITHDFDDVTTMTNVRGRLSKPELVLTSVPASYSQSELLGFLLGGEPGGDPNAGGARDKLTGAGESFIAGQLGNYVKRALPFDIDVIKYEAAGVDSSAAITVGSWLTHSLFFAFREHIDARPDENSGEGTLEYFLTKRIEIQGTAGDRNYDAIDFLWRRRF